MTTKRSATLLIVPLLAALLLPAAFAAAAEDGQRVLSGRYTSGYQDRPANLRAVFTPSGSDSWTVVFHFSHAGRRYLYRGTATGNLVSGVLSGRVENDNGSRIFTFRCEFDNGKCDGTHSELYRGSEQETGKLTLES